MQHEIVNETDLLDHRGNLLEPGWARRPLFRYNRENLAASPLRLKEWDYYAILSRDWGLALTMADNGYMSFLALTWFDFTLPEETSFSLIKPLPLGRMAMPRDSRRGDAVFRDGKLLLSFLTRGDEKILTVDCPSFGKGRGLSGEITLFRDPAMESMVIATPFNRSGHFYFNEKVNCLAPRGTVRMGNGEYTFDPARDAAVLDWGRGVWTYQNTWYWSSASGFLGDAPFGFNLGYGFGDTSAATENVLFYKGRIHKLGEVKFAIPGEPEGRERYLEPWRFADDTGRLELEFRPLLDRSSKTSLGVIKSDQHQVFGDFSGKVRLDDGETLVLDRFQGFAEKVFNRW